MGKKSENMIVSRTQKVSKSFETLKHEHIMKYFEGVSNIYNSAFERITMVTEIRSGCDITLISNCNI